MQLVPFGPEMKKDASKCPWNQRIPNYYNVHVAQHMVSIDPTTTASPAWSRPHSADGNTRDGSSQQGRRAHPSPTTSAPRAERETRPTRSKQATTGVFHQWSGEKPGKEVQPYSPWNQRNPGPIPHVPVSGRQGRDDGSGGRNQAPLSLSALGVDKPPGPTSQASGCDR